MRLDISDWQPGTSLLDYLARTHKLVCFSFNFSKGTFIEVRGEAVPVPNQA